MPGRTAAGGEVLTLLPSKEFAVRGHEGKAYEVNEWCAVPLCARASAHAHHIWPRSHLRSQPYEWVELPDGTVIGNRIGLCLQHHNNVTGEIGGYRARILFTAGLFWWELPPDGSTPLKVWERVGPLDPQPPGVPTQRQETPAEEAVCPTCGHAKRRRSQNGTPRKSKTWTLTVPDDAEIGTDVLDEWADDLAVILGFHDETSRLRRYHAVVTALAWTVQNREAFVRDLRTASR